MLSGEGKENGEKTTIGLISKKAALHVQHTFFCTFLCRCFARLRHETSRNFSVTQFLEKKSYVFSFNFLMPVIFTLHWWPQAFVTTATKCSCCSSHKKKNEKCFLRFFFISCSRSLSSFYSLSFAGLPPTFPFSLSFSCSIFQICGHDN